VIWIIARARLRLLRSVDVTRSGILTRGEIKRCKLLVLLPTLVASTTAPALAADGSTNCDHLRRDAPVQIHVPRLPHLSGALHG
jgi:hypothetical protein